MKKKKKGGNDKDEHNQHDENNHQHVQLQEAFIDEHEYSHLYQSELEEQDEFDDEEDDDDEDDDDDSIISFPSFERPIWSQLLGQVSRASWRVSGVEPPLFLARAHATVMSRALGKDNNNNSSKSSKQLKRIYQNTIWPKYEALARARHLQRLQNYRREQEKRKNVETTSTSTNVTPASPVYYTPNYTMAYCQERFLPQYAIVHRILQETKSLLSVPPNIKSVLDFGFGSGAASLAALKVFGQWNFTESEDDDDDDSNTNQQQHHDDDGGGGIEWIHGIEPSKSMQQMGQALFHQALEQTTTTTTTKVPPRLTLASSLSSSSSSSSSQFDLVLMSCTGVELPQTSHSLVAAAMLWKKLSPNGGIFVMVEPGTPDGFHLVKSVRSMLLSCCNQQEEEEEDDDEDEDEDEEEDEEGEDDDDEADDHYEEQDDDVQEPSTNDHEQEVVWDECRIIAPCTHSGSCPMSYFTDKNDPIKEDEEDFDHDIFISKHQEEALAAHDDGIEMTNKQQQQDLLISDGRIGPRLEELPSERSYCSFVHYIPGSRGKQRGEKFSYLVAQKIRRGPNQENNDNIDEVCNDNLTDFLSRSYQQEHDDNPDNEEALQAQLQELLDKMSNSDIENDPLEIRDLIGGLQQQEEEDSMMNIDKKRSSFGRLIRAPKKRKGHVMLDYCVGLSCRNGNCSRRNDNMPEVEGKLIRQFQGKQRSNQVAPGQYVAARKARWGGLWPHVAVVDGNKEE